MQHVEERIKATNFACEQFENEKERLVKLLNESLV